MSTLPDCQHAVILIVAKDDRGLWRVAPSEQGLASYTLELDYRVNTSKQIRMAAARFLKLDERAGDIQIEGPITPALAVTGGSEALLWLARLPDDVEAVSEAWVTLPILLRAMPKDRNRLSYMKAMQILSGATEQGVNAIEIDDQVREALLNKNLDS